MFRRLFISALCCIAFAANAMSLTPAQTATLKTFINSTYSGVFDQSTVAALNAAASPAFVVWKTRVTRSEILQNVGYDWTRLDNLSVGKARIWSDIFVDGVINPAMPNVRIGIDAVWVGTTADLAVRTAVYAQSQRSATVAEKLFATGTGSAASPATMSLTAEGPITLKNVEDAGQ